MNPLKIISDNIQWIIASIVLAFGIWIVAAIQNDPVQQRSFPRTVPIQFVVGDTMIIDGSPNVETVQVVVRAPRSVWDVLRSDQITITANATGLSAGEHSVRLTASLADGVRGRVVELTPPEVVLTLTERNSQRIPVSTLIAQGPPVGYSYAAPTCTLREVTASGSADQLDGLEAVARLDLSEDRSTVEHEVMLVPVNSAGRTVTDVILEPSQVTCEVIISPNEGITELSVVPVVQGFPQSGYIYEGFEFTPKTVLVSGAQSAISNMNGVVKTEPISLTGASSTFERTASLDLPGGVFLQPPIQTINITILIGTVRGSRQYEGIPVEIEGVGAGTSAEALPKTVTVFVVGPRPLLQELTTDALRVTVDVSDLDAGTHQITAEVSVTVDSLQAQITTDTTITVQPPEINVTIVENSPNTMTPSLPGED